MNNQGLMGKQVADADKKRSDILDYRKKLLGRGGSLKKVADSLADNAGSAASMSSEKDMYQGLRDKLDGSIGWRAQMQNNQFAFQGQQADLDRQQQMDVLDKQHEQQMGVLDKQYEQQVGTMNLQNQFENESLAKTTSANLQGRYVDAIQDIVDNAAVSINEIETSAGMTQEEKDAMIQNTIARRDADLAFTRQLYSNMPTWDFSWLDQDAMPAAPGMSTPQEQVNSLYQEVLGRTADQEGMNMYVDMLNNGTSIDRIREILTGSPEYQQRNQGGA